MAKQSLGLYFPASMLIGDNDAQLVAGDVGAPHASFLGRTALAFDADNEEAALTPEVIMPSGYAGGTLKATVTFFADNSADDVAIDIFIEAKTMGTDTLNLETVSSWDSANSGTVSLAGSTAKDPLSMDITLTNKDSVAAGDLVRFGIRRDTDSGNDDAATDLNVFGFEIWEDV